MDSCDEQQLAHSIGGVHYKNMLSDETVPWTLEQIKNYYKEYSSSYDKDINLESYPAPFIIASWLKQELCAKKQVKVMDLGCGTGMRYT